MVTLSLSVLDHEREALEELASLSNWGRWGEDDERGALNFVDREAIQRAIAVIQKGNIYPLGIHIRENNVPLLEGRPAPLHLMGLNGGDWAAGAGKDRPTQTAEDYLVIGTHGTTTHIDALCHAWSGHKMYNGFSGNLVRSYGAIRLGIENIEGIVTKGVLLDIAGHRGVEVMDPDDLVTAADVEACSRDEGVTIERGDAVLVRTGWTQMFYRDPQAYSGMQPGVGSSAGLLLARREICLLGADNTAVNPYSGYNPRYPNRTPPADPRDGLAGIHVPYLRNLGIYLLEMLTLEQLAADRVYEFMFCLAPLLIKGGTASPVNPLAVD